MPLKNKNNLFIVRKKSDFGQKQIAALLGHQTIDQISRYERGTRIPSLKTALKLQIIYRLPIHVLFYAYYEICFKEIKAQDKSSGGGENKLKPAGLLKDIEFCTIAEQLKLPQVSEAELDKARSHIAELVRVRGEKMGHFTVRQ